MNLKDDVHKVMSEILERATFAEFILDDERDRLWDAGTNTWWKRVGNKLTAADPPKGWNPELRRKERNWHE